MGKRKIRIYSVLIGLGVLAVLLKQVTGFFPELVERIYARGLFAAIRFLLDYSFGLLPFSSLYLLILALFLWCLLHALRRKGKKKESRRWLRVIGAYLAKGLSLASLIVFLGYVLWGYNYDRLPVETHLGLTLRPLDGEMIRRHAREAVGMVRLSRSQIVGATDRPLSGELLPKNLESVLRNGFQRVLSSMDYPVLGRVRLRRLFPGGLLMSFGVAGFYFPFSGEANLPHNLTADEIPFAAAHEMAHAYGFAEEGAANFLAFLVCISANEPVIRYSGYLGYFHYIGSELYRLSAREYRETLRQLPHGVLADIRQSRENWRRHQSWLTDLGRKVNNLYLKSQGVREGILSYNRFLVLYTAYQRLRPQG